MTEKRNPKDINRKLRSLTQDQANALAAALNGDMGKGKPPMTQIEQSQKVPEKTPGKK